MNNHDVVLGAPTQLSRGVSPVLFSSAVVSREQECRVEFSHDDDRGVLVSMTHFIPSARRTRKSINNWRVYAYILYMVVGDLTRIFLVVGDQRKEDG